jgi:pyruvate-formate lyase-activating enzyme
MTSPINIITSVLKVSTNIVTNVTARPIKNDQSKDTCNIELKTLNEDKHKKLKKVSNTDRPYQNPVVNRVLVKCKQFFYDTQRVTHSQVRWVRFF